jgi:hypothetical protein
MKITAFLTLAAMSAVAYEWLLDGGNGTATAPEFMMLAVAVTGLGLQTLRSEKLREGGEEYEPAPVVIRAETNV